jgi:hypothetical protein
MRNVFGILSFIVSGLFVCTVCIIGFVDVPESGSEIIWIIGLFSIPLIVFHLIGIALYRGTNWKISTGITFFVGASLNILGIISFFSMYSSPDFLETMKTMNPGVSTSNPFKISIGGLTLTALFAGSGAALLYNGKLTGQSGKTEEMPLIRIGKDKIDMVKQFFQRHYPQLIKSPKQEKGIQRKKINVAEEIEKFFLLKEKGMITEEEYQAKKNKLIGL